MSKSLMVFLIKSCDAKTGQQIRTSTDPAKPNSTERNLVKLEIDCSIGKELRWRVGLVGDRLPVPEHCYI